MPDLNRQNHFQRFDLEENFDIDLDLLEEKYLNYQQLFHPDKLAHKSKKDQINLEHNSILITESYEILKDSLKRAIYLLKLSGIDINDDNCDIKPDQETLIENLELRESIFENDEIPELNEIKKSCQNEIKLLVKRSKKYFEKQDFEKCALPLIKAKYFNKAILEIKKKIKK